MLPIESNGDVVDCMYWGSRPIDNVRNKPFSEILKSPRLRELAGKEGESCNKCVSLHRVEISEIWDGNLEPLVSWWKNLGQLEVQRRWKRRLQPVRRLVGRV